MTLMDVSDVPAERNILDHLLDGAADQWSGGVYARPLPDGTYLCILNPTHPITRRRITLMEEISHVFLKHAPTGLKSVSPGICVRDYDPEQEREAYGVGAAAIIPWASLFQDLNRSSSVSFIAKKYAISEPLVNYRIGITGATNLYKARQRARGLKRVG